MNFHIFVHIRSKFKLVITANPVELKKLIFWSVIPRVPMSYIKQIGQVGWLRGTRMPVFSFCLPVVVSHNRTIFHAIVFKSSGC